jgi:hypothetical protein
MAFDVTPHQMHRLRLRAQRLEPGAMPVAGVAEVVKALCGLQAQDMAAAMFAIRPRGPGLVAADVERARVEARSLVRTWAMRGTLHLLAVQDLGWLLGLLGPVFIGGSRRRQVELGLDEETRDRAVRALRTLLASRGPLTRPEIVEQLAGRGIHLWGQAAPHLLHHAALLGFICYGPDRGREPTYVLLEDWADVGPPLPEHAGLTELTRRFLGGYGPAAPADLAYWSGLPLGVVRRGWDRILDELLEVRYEGRAAWMLRARAEWLHDPPAASPTVRLLPGYDPYLLGYRSRELTAPVHARRIHPGGGLLRPVLLVDGRAVATWRITRRRRVAEVALEPFEPLTPLVHAGLEREVADLGRFAGVASELVLQSL